MITCRELLDFLMDYDDGKLSAAEREEFERHLKVCPPCVNYLASYRRTVQLGKQAYASEQQAAPPEVPEDLIRGILAARKRSGGSP